MSGPTDGKYLILLAGDAGIPLVLGVDDDGGAPVAPVVAGGYNNVWTLKGLPDGNYHLLLEEAQRPLYIQADEGNLVGNKDPPPFSWAIERVEDGASYTIKERVGIVPSKFWTLKDPVLKSPVTLDYSGQPNQQWNLIPRPSAE